MSVKIEFNRQNLRLPGHDYSAEGSYFITICTDKHIFHFGAIFSDQMVLNEIGIIAKNEWFKLPNRFPFIHLGPFCVMPNHIHGIINVTSPHFSSSSNYFDGLISVGAGASPAPTEKPHQKKVKKVTLGNIVDAYKSLVMRACLAEHKVNCHEGTEAPALGKIWKRNYHEHIIRTQQSYDSISAYIITNPLNWTKDKFYIKFE